jgi:DNA repair protein RadC
MSRQRGVRARSGDRANLESKLGEAALSPGEEPFRSSLELPRPLRPQEKLLARGPRALTQGELLAVVLGPGNRREPARRVADRLVRRHGLGGLAELSAGAWRRERGLGCAAAARLCAVFELGRRTYSRDDAEERPTVSGPRQAFRQVRHLTRVRKEHLIGLYLDAQNGLLGRETISIGSLNTTRTHPREILYPAVAHLALGFILAHNHPSGCLEPSREDIEFTRSIRRAGELMGIELYDHLIVAQAGYTSLRERGLL